MHACMHACMYVRTYVSMYVVFLQLRSRKTVRFSEQIMSADKYPSIFSRQMAAIFYVSLPSAGVSRPHNVTSSQVAC